MNSPNDGHLTNEELLEDMDGHPSARMAEHCAICPACRALRRQVSDVLGALRFEPEPALSDDVRVRLMRRHARAHRARSVIRRFVTYRIPLYQIAAAAAAIVMLAVMPGRHQPAPRGGSLPPFVAAVSDLWFPHAGNDSGALGSTNQEAASMVARPPLELDANGPGARVSPPERKSVWRDSG